MKKTILLNIGNTHVQKVLFDGESFLEYERIPTRDFTNQVRHRSLSYLELPIFIACVVPSAEIALRDCYQGNSKFLDYKNINGVNFSAVDAPAIGADRLANLSAALKNLTPPLLIVDCGTAITIEIIDEEYNFWSGVFKFILTTSFYIFFHIFH